MPDYTRWLNTDHDTPDDEVFAGLYAELRRIARPKAAGERPLRSARCDALAALPELEVLDLRSTLISDIGFLKDAKKLRELDLSGSKVTDISVLAGATALERLDLSDTKITDLSPLLPLVRADGLPLIEIPERLSDSQRRMLAEARTLSPAEMKRIAPTGLTLVVCNPDNEVIDTLVVPQHPASGDYVFRIPEGMDEIRVFAVGSRIRKNEYEWEDVYIVARADDKISQNKVTASVEDGVLSGISRSMNTHKDSRPIRLSEKLRNQIHADIVAKQRTMRIDLWEKQDDGHPFRNTIKVTPVK